MWRGKWTSTKFLLVSLKLHSLWSIYKHLLTTSWESGSFWSRRTSPYSSSELASCNFFRFLKIKGTSMGPVWRRGGHQKAVTTELRKILENSLQQCIEAWQRRMECMTRGKLSYRRNRVVWCLDLKYLVTSVALLSRHTSYRGSLSSFLIINLVENLFQITVGVGHDTCCRLCCLTSSCNEDSGWPTWRSSPWRTCSTPHTTV